MERHINKFVKYFLWFVLSVIVMVNMVAYFHAYKFTHFSTSVSAKTSDAKKLSFGDKVQIILFGVSNPRPKDSRKPHHPFQTIKLKSNKTIECWLIKTPNAKGTVIMFHGFGGDKSSLLDKAEIFLKQGYNTLLVDFMGSGGSEGDQTTIGFYEALEVNTAYDYTKKSGERNIYLFGTSMGAVAVMKCLHDTPLEIRGIILECPFGSMLKTVEARFNTMHIPTFPLANLLVFWGGLQNNFDAFKHNPVDYASNINCPTLLLYGQLDDKVSRKEIDGIDKNLRGPTKLVLFPRAGHDDYLKLYQQQWSASVSAFLNGDVTN